MSFNSVMKGFCHLFLDVKDYEEMLHRGQGHVIDKVMKCSQASFRFLQVMWMQNKAAKFNRLADL